MTQGERSLPTVLGASLQNLGYTTEDAADLYVEIDATRR